MEKVTYHKDIIFAYPIYYSNLPKIVRDFICENSDIWKGKRVFIIATMGLFSGDSASSCKIVQTIRRTGMGWTPLKCRIAFVM